MFYIIEKCFFPFYSNLQHPRHAAQTHSSSFKIKTDKFYSLASPSVFILIYYCFLGFSDCKIICKTSEKNLNIHELNSI